MRFCFFSFGLSILVFCFLSSCSFNKKFLKPTTIPPAVKQMDITTADGKKVHYTNDNRPPVFTQNGDTVQNDYSVESVIFTNDSKHKLHGFLLKPRNTEPTITLLHLHGNAGFIFSHLGFIAPLVKEGFQVFTFDYSGYGFSEGRATRKNVLTDAISAIDYLKGRDDVKNTTLIIYGQSLGGHLAAVVAEKKQADIDGVIIEGAFSSHKDIAAHRMSVLGKVFVKQGYSAKESITNIKKPVLIIHSGEDDVIPYRMGKTLFEKAKEPKKFLSVKGCHICATVSYSNEIAEIIRNFMIKDRHD